jgi:hypothetical protein
MNQRRICTRSPRLEIHARRTARAAGTIAALALWGCMSEAADDAGTQTDDAGTQTDDAGDGGTLGDDSGGAPGGTQHPEREEITEDTTWRRADGPHLVTNGVRVTDATLTIEPGTEVRFESGGIEVDGAAGSLVAHGTAEDPILFVGIGAEACHVIVGGNLPLGSADLEHATFRDCHGGFVHPGVISGRLHLIRMGREHFHEELFAPSSLEPAALDTDLRAVDAA